MAFPSSLDSFTNPSAANKLNSPSHAGIETAQNTALGSLEAKVGADGSAVTTSFDYKLSQITGADKAAGLAASQTLSNKIMSSPTINTPTFSAGAVTTAAIADNNVTLVKIASVAWTTYTVTTTNVTLGTGGTCVGMYQKVGRDVQGTIQLTLGTGGVFTGEPSFTLPVTSVSYGTRTMALGTGLATDTGTNAYPCMAVVASTTTIVPYTVNPSGSVGFSATVPFTWGNTDTLGIKFSFQSAA